MKRITVGFLALLAAGVFAMTADSQPPDGKDRPQGNRGGDGGPPGGPGGRPGGPGMGPGRFEVGRLLPLPARQELKLTEDQEKQLAELEKSVKEKLSKILTPDQMKRLENFQPRGGRGGPGGGPGGPGGPGRPGAGPGGPGGSPGDRGRPPDGDRGRPRGNPDNPPPPNDHQANAENSGGIQWFATRADGLAEARRTGKPILFVAAAPHCAGVSGIW